MSSPVITKVAGPLVKASGMASAKMFEVVRVAKEKLVGEIIELHGDEASIQVYEETGGVQPGEPVTLSGQTLSVELGPGLLGSIYDGIQRPLESIEKQAKSPFISRGIDVDALDRKKKWEFTATKEKGETVSEGDILGTVPETTLIEHKVMVPPGISGKLTAIKSGTFLVTDTIATVEAEDGTKHEIQMLQRWPIRRARPVDKKMIPSSPLVTGIRVLDTMFPMAKGGAGAIPGPFGAGKTVTQQSLAKYCDAQVIVYIGCGERGNEMTEVLTEFPHLVDPNTGEPLMKRTILIANTSNMPVAAREASVYTGITIAEYYRDMGYDVALMADSTSRWAEAMREMSGRLEEMPGEEGYPAYLGSRTAGFYERAGAVECLGDDDRKGSLTVIGAVSPPGGDFSEPVTQNTLRVTKTFWALDAKLAYKRHFPSINWLQSYSLYAPNVKSYFEKEIDESYMEQREQALNMLQEESRLEEIVRLVGLDALSGREQLLLETTRMIREDFLFQNAFDPEDAYTPPAKQFRILRAIMRFYQQALPLVQDEDFDMQKLRDLSVREEIGKAHLYNPEEDTAFDALDKRIDQEISALS